jgi:hypothetical protein
MEFIVEPLSSSHVMFPCMLSEMAAIAGKGSDKRLACNVMDIETM